MNQLTRCKPMLGTYVEISLSADFSDDALLEISSAMFAEVAKVDVAMSYHNPDSELSYLNRNAWREPCELSSAMEMVLQQSLQLSRKTNGLFDITVAPVLTKHAHLPDLSIEVSDHANWEHIQIGNNTVRFAEKLLIDLGGIAKGYAVDQAFSVLQGGNVEAVVNAGGDMRMSHWENQVVGIRHPSNRSRVLDVPMRAAAVATSASYFLDNVSAIVFPRSAKPIDMTNSISVFSKQCMLADALTKVAALGFDNKAFYESLGAEVFTFDQQGNSWFE